MSDYLNEQVMDAHTFFNGDVFMEEAVATPVPAKTPTMFEPKGNTTGSVMQFLGQIPSDATPAEKKAFAALLKDQQFYLQSGLGLVTAWLTSQFGRSVDEWANYANWDNGVGHLPSEFYTPIAGKKYHFDEHMKGVSVATSFIKILVGWASGAGIATAFTGFLDGLGKQISAGVKTKDTTMKTYNLSFSYQPIQDAAGNWQLVSKAKYYMISFSQKEKVVYSSCASAEEFDFVFDYYSGTILLNWATLDNPVTKDARKAWDGVINQTTRDDVEKSKNFFSHNASSA